MACAIDIIKVETRRSQLLAISGSCYSQGELATQKVDLRAYKCLNSRGVGMFGWRISTTNCSVYLDRAVRMRIFERAYVHKTLVCHLNVCSFTHVPSPFSAPGLKHSPTQGQRPRYPVLVLGGAVPAGSYLNALRCKPATLQHLRRSPPLSCWLLGVRGGMLAKYQHPGRLGCE